MFYIILILFLTIYYFWVKNVTKSVNDDSPEQVLEETVEKEAEQVQLVETETRYLNEDNESFDSLSYEVELGFPIEIIIGSAFN